jgi:hypothetical protein
MRALAVGTRFDTLRRELGDNFIVVEFPGRKHATLTEHRQPQGVDRVLAFFEEKLKPTAGPARAECKRTSFRWCVHPYLTWTRTANRRTRSRAEYSICSARAP